MRLPVKKLLLLAFVLSIATPALAWDKAANPKRRLEILAGAAKRSDSGELASCFTPPFDKEVMQNLLAETIEYEKNMSRLFQAVAEKIGGQEGVDALGDYKEAVTDLHFLCGTTVTVGNVKEEPDKAVARITFKDADGSFEGHQDLLLVKVGEDDWRIVFDQEPWPGGDKDKFVTELSSAAGKWSLELNNVANAFREDRLTKEQVEAQVKSAKTTMKQCWFRMRESRAETMEADKQKAAAKIADAAKKDAAAKKAVEDEAAKKEAAKKDAAKKEAAKNAPPPPPTPVVAKKEDKKDEKKKDGEGEEEKKKEPDNTGMFIVFGVLGVACLVVVGVLLSKMRGDKQKGGGGGGGGGRSGRRSARGASGRSGGGSSSGSGDKGSSSRQKRPGKKPPGKSKRASADGEDDES